LVFGPVAEGGNCRPLVLRDTELIFDLVQPVRSANLFRRDSLAGLLYFLGGLAGFVYALTNNPELV